MDRRVKELIEETKVKFSLAAYELKRYGLHRDVNIFNETVYTLSMEWFPEGVEEPADESNPEGAAVIEVHVPSQQVASAIFVKGKTYAKSGINFTGLDTDGIIEWVEQETGLMYGKQLQLYKEEEGKLLFNEVIDGIAVSPSGSLEINYDEEGNLTLFAVHGHFPSKEMIREEAFALSFDKVEQVAKEQLKLIKFPSFEHKKLIPVYGVEEIYLTNDQMVKIPFEWTVDERSNLPIDQTIYFDQTVTSPFERQEVTWSEEVTADQAFSAEPSPDSRPITDKEQKKCFVAIKYFLLQEYPDDSEKWILKTLQRDNGFIFATLRDSQEGNRIFQRKLTVIIDPVHFQAVNYVDNQAMLAIFDDDQAPAPAVIDKEAAYQKLKELYEFTPYYVYDFKRRQYVLCGKVDCDYGVEASTGRVIALEDL